MSHDQATPAIVCYSPTMITTNGIWHGDNPLQYSLPLFIVQLTLVVVTTRVLGFILKPFHQPHVIAEILGGVILGPSVLGRIKGFSNTIFPMRSAMVLETMANLGLLYFLFLIGVEMDLAVIRRTGKRAISFGIGGMILPFVSGCVFSLITHKDHHKHTFNHDATFILFIGVALAVTAFPVLARILAELKLLNTEMGRIAMSSALVSDISAWILLALAISLAETNTSPLTSLWVVLSSALFVIICIVVVRPIIIWIIRKTPEGEPFSDFYICLILTGVMVSAFITDAIGTHSVFGAFVFGLIIPNGPLGITLIEKLEDFVSGLLLPLFFAISGLKTQVDKVQHYETWLNLLILVLLGCVGKVGGVVAVSYFYNMPLREGLTLGLLMNSKGLVEMIVLNMGKDQKVLDDASFSVMVVCTILMTGIVGPLVSLVYRPARRYVSYKRRTIRSSRSDSEFRVLTCIHSPRNVPTIISILDASNPTTKSPICVNVLHLVELTGRASAMLIVHSTRKSGRPALNRTQAQSDHIINAFENYEQQTDCVSVQPVTAISPYSSMHEDICNVAEEKRVALIILPFHKQQGVDGVMEVANATYRTINQNVLANSPCSVAILVDRGLTGSSTARSTSDQASSHNVAVLFFGGPDDREALAYALRMSEHPDISITVMRFRPTEEASGFPGNQPNGNDPGVLTVMTDTEKEKQLDEDYIKDLSAKIDDGDDSLTYVEQLANNGEETVAAIRSIDKVYDLYIVGRGQGMISPLTAGLTDWSECPELGAIGDLLASSDSAVSVSVLVLQQYVGSETSNEEGLRSPNSPEEEEEIGGRNHQFEEQYNDGMNRRRQGPSMGQDVYHS